MTWAGYWEIRADLNLTTWASPSEVTLCPQFSALPLGPPSRFHPSRVEFLEEFGCFRAGFCPLVRDRKRLRSPSAPAGRGPWRGLSLPPQGCLLRTLFSSADHGELGRGQAAVRAEGREGGTRLDTVDRGRRAAPGGFLVVLGAPWAQRLGG